jgi:hypothetical protein
MGVSLLLIIVVVPALEEFAFRGWFTNSILMMLISLTLLSYYFFNAIIKLTYPLLDKPLKIWLIAFLLICSFSFFFKNRYKLFPLIETNKFIAILLSISLFTLIHTFNYKIKEVNIGTLAGLSLILLPMSFAAYLLTYIRIKNGLVWSYALHVLNNSLILFPAIFGSEKI